MKTTVLIRSPRGCILVEPIYPKQEGRIYTGHIKPDDISTMGRVVSIGSTPVGKNGRPIELDYKRGDIVMLQRFKCVIVDLHGKQLIKIRQSDVIAVFEAEPEIPKGWKLNPDFEKAKLGIRFATDDLK